MKRMRSGIRSFFSGQRGISLLETVVAVAILAAIAVTILNGMNTAIRSTAVADEHTTAESLAQSQMEWVKKIAYSEEATQYTPASLPSGSDFQNYSVTITAQPLDFPDAGLQKITVMVKYGSETAFILEGYKRQQ